MVFLYADDTKIHSSSKDIDDAEVNLNQDLNRVSTWFNENSLIGNTKKSQAIRTQAHCTWASSRSSWQLKDAVCIWPEAYIRRINKACTIQARFEDSGQLPSILIFNTHFNQHFLTLQHRIRQITKYLFTNLFTISYIKHDENKRVTIIFKCRKKKSTAFVRRKQRICPCPNLYM